MNNANGNRKLSREEIESLCLLAALGNESCTAVALTERLGLSPALADAVDQSIATLVTCGRVQRNDSGLEVTAAGIAWYQDRIGVSADTN